jgi:hypothetical protein
MEYTILNVESFSLNTLTILLLPPHDSYKVKCKHQGLTPINPSYSGGRQQEDHNSKSSQENTSQNPISKKSITKKGWWSGSR